MAASSSTSVLGSMEVIECADNDELLFKLQMFVGEGNVKWVKMDHDENGKEYYRCCHYKDCMCMAEMIVDGLKILFSGEHEGHEHDMLDEIGLMKALHFIE
uniref:FLYWCH-type domain-containing protein n=1 Tax=Meloidogyne incognita TaxID=6306 RepID=A0A914MYZ1_MELIC